MKTSHRKQNLLNRSRDLQRLLRIKVHANKWLSLKNSKDLKKSCKKPMVETWNRISNRNEDQVIRKNFLKLVLILIWVQKKKQLITRLFNQVEVKSTAKLFKWDLSPHFLIKKAGSLIPSQCSRRHNLKYQWECIHVDSAKVLCSQKTMF
jgi:hypothetical protein